MLFRSVGGGSFKISSFTYDGTAVVEPNSIDFDYYIIR